MRALTLKTTLFTILTMLFVIPMTHGQILKKLRKRAEKAAERTIERRVEKETAEKTDQVLDSILEPGSNQQGDNPLPQGNEGPNSSDQPSDPISKNSKTSNSRSLNVFSKFDFVPGDELLFYDDFSSDFIGDFPAKWNTNGGGEIVRFDDDSGNWFELTSGTGTYYVANLNDLPEDYTIEFDIEVNGIEKVSSSATLRAILTNDPGFEYGTELAWVYIPLVQWTSGDIRVWSRIGGKDAISNRINADIRKNIMNRAHISIAVNGQRYRVYVDETKYVDIPRMIGPGGPMTHFKFQLSGTDKETERVFVSNIKIAKGGVDLRKKLLSEGRISTNAILFDSGSANLQPRSMGVIRQISQVLMQDSNISLQIVGHTDSDGSADENQSLSEKRAAAVKEALVSVYGIDGSRLQSMGKGESEPVSDNDSPEGKAKNRRVEFIKQ